MPTVVSARGSVLALIVPASEPIGRGISFYTDSKEQMQIAGMLHPAGHVIQAHIHNPAPRTIDRTHEALFVRRGRVRMDIYDEARQLVSRHDLGPGDVVLLLAGGHGFQVEEDAEIIEVKQGPFLGDWEKSRFTGAG